jgi:DNA-binding NtrC family response regulator
VMARLARRAWPGNVRELQNEVARLCVLSEGKLDDPALVREPADTTLDASGASATAPNYLRPMSEIERDAIEQALRASGGDKRKAADLLGISRAKVYQRLKEWREAGRALAGDDGGE